MISCRLPDFDIEQIAASGQCFRFRRQGEGRYSLIAGGKWLEIEQNGDTVFPAARTNLRRSGGIILI